MSPAPGWMGKAAAGLRVALARSDAATAVEELRAAAETDPRVLSGLGLAFQAAGDLEATRLLNGM